MDIMSLFVPWIDKEIVAPTHNEIFLSHKEQWSYDIYRKTDAAEGDYAKQNRPESERQMLHFLPYTEQSFMCVWFCVCAHMPVHKCTHVCMYDKKLDNEG